MKVKGRVDIEGRLAYKTQLCGLYWIESFSADHRHTKNN